jgi:hypothetical protein
VFRPVASYATLSGTMDSRRAGRPPGGVLDEEHDVQAAQELGIDVDEVSRQDRVGVGGQKRRPGLATAVGCGIDSGVLEDLPDGRWRDLVAGAGQFTRGSAGSPTLGLLRAIFQRQIADSSRDRRASRATVRVIPVAFDDVGVPAQQGTR